MNALDIIILVPVIIFVFKGFRKGLVIELASLAALFLGIYLGIYFSDFVAGLLIKHLGFSANYTSAVAFTLIFVAVIIIMRLIAKTIEKALDLTALGFFNKILGAVFGLLKVLFLVSLILYVIVKFDPYEKILTRTTKDNSRLYKPVSIIAPTAIPRIKTEYENFQKKDTVINKLPLNQK